MLPGRKAYKWLYCTSPTTYEPTSMLNHTLYRKTFTQEDRLYYQVDYVQKRKGDQSRKNIQLDKHVKPLDNPCMVLLKYKNSPIDAYASPTQLLMSLQLCSINPCIEKSLQKLIVLIIKYIKRKEVQLR